MMGSGGWVIWGVGRGGRWGVRNFREISKNFSGNFEKISGKYMVIRKRKIIILKRQYNIFSIVLHESNSMIMLNSQHEYLRNDKIIR